MKILKLLDMVMNKIINVGAPVNDNDATTKKYVDDGLDTKLGASSKAVDSEKLDNISSSGFAQVKNIASGADLNTLTTSGIYRLGSSNTNMPVGAASYGQLLVMYGLSDTITQMYCNYTGGKSFIRSGNPTDVGGSGSWGSWKEFSYSDHNHSGVYEPVFTKNSGFNKALGTSAGQVAEGNHTHSALYAALSHYHTRIRALAHYTWNDDTKLPRDYNYGVETCFVTPADGWPNYGTVLTVKGHTSAQDGGTLQLYTPYGPSHGGDPLQYRTGMYDNAGWTAWKTIANIDQVLAKTNTTTFTPTADYHPATKKYVDDNMTSYNITSGTADPSGGSDGDIYFQYE
jgi:hypothetical protein